MFLTPLSPSTAAARLFEFRARWPIAAATCNGRTERACHLAQVPNLVDLTAPGVFVVRSESNPLGYYTVNVANRTCTCPDHGTHTGVICKHRLVVAFYTAFGVEPHPVPDPYVFYYQYFRSCQDRGETTPADQTRLADLWQTARAADPDVWLVCA